MTNKYNNSSCESFARGDNDTPEWLERAIGEYFDDPVPIPSPSLTPLQHGDAHQRSLESTNAARVLTQMRAPASKLLGEVTDLPELIRKAAVQIEADPRIVAKWLTRGTLSDIETSILDPEVFARLAIALDLPLAIALRLRPAHIHREERVSVRKSGHSEFEDSRADHFSDVDSGISEDADFDAIVRACYREEAGLE